MYDDAIDILKKLEYHGYKAYIVGGYPRNLYLNINSNDIDICTNAKPEEIYKIFDNVDLKNSLYGNAIVTINNHKYEITTFRKELKYINNRKPEKIEFLDKLEDDLIRRDFIINTLCIDSNKQYIDLFGAIDDLNKKVIRLVGDKSKLKEDALRILRAIRFATTLNFEIDEKLDSAINEYAYLVSNLSYFRKKQELDLIFKSGNKMGIDLLIKYNLHKYLNIEKLTNIKKYNNYLDIWKQLDVKDIYPFTKEEKNYI